MKISYRLMVASVFTAAAAIGCSAIANADWDIEKYDACMKQPHQESDEGYHGYCCLMSGGEWNGSKCVAPAANAQDPGATTMTPIGPPPGAVNPAPPTAVYLP
jgi:hypothetical protein